MKPMTVKQLQELLNRAPDDACIWFEKWEYGEDGEFELMSHPINFGEIKYTNNAFDMEDYGVTLKCSEAEEWDEDEQAPIDPTALEPEQLKEMYKNFTRNVETR